MLFTQMTPRNRASFIPFHLTFTHGVCCTSTLYSSVTLAGLLNALDGIEAAEGRLLFATTNHKESLDPALYRPGRMDVHVEFGKASKYQAKELFKRFYPKDEFGMAVRSTKRLPSTPTPSGSGFSRIASRQTSVDNHVSGYTEDLVSAVSSAAQEISAFLESSGQVSEPPVTTAPGYPKAQDSPGHDVEFLANRFSSLVPERSCTMAMLQEYLMNYKRDPVGASLEENVKAYLDRMQLARSIEDEEASKVQATETKDGDEGVDEQIIHKGALEGEVADILE